MYDFDDDNPSLMKRIRFFLNRSIRWVPNMLLSVGEWADRLWRRMLGRDEQRFDDGYQPNKFFYFFSNILGWLTWLPRKMVSGSDQFEKGFRKASIGLGEGAGGADSGFQKVIKLVFGPIARIFGQFAAILFGPLVNKLRSSHFASRLARGTWWIWYPFVAIASFGQTFWHTRKWAAVILFLALMVPTGTLLFIAWRVNRQQSLIAKDYRRAVEDAVSRGDLDKAQMLRFKLQALGVRADRFEMQQVNELARAGKIEDAIESAENLAPQDKLGMVEAHFWLVQQYLNDSSKIGSAASNQKAEVHLELLTAAANAKSQGGALPPNIVLLTAMLELKKGNGAKGIGLLQSIDNFWPAVALLLEIHAGIGRSDESMKCAVWLMKAMKNDRQMIDELPETIFPPLHVAASKYGSPSDVEEIVSAWNRRFPQNKMANASNSKVLMQEVEALVNQGGESEMQQAAQKLIEAANKLDKEFMGLLYNWMLVRIDARSNDSNKNYQKLFEIVESNPDLSAGLLEILGSVAVKQGNDVKGLELLKRSIDLSPRNANVWNNIAYITLKSGMNLDFALQAAENAINLAPENHAYYTTRGMANLRLQQWQPAIDDFKRVIAQNPNSREVHRGLAQAYSAIGEKELASIHQSQAESNR